MSQEVIYTSESVAARRRIYFQLVDATDGLTAKTGITGAGRISKNGAATAASTNNIVEIDAANMPGRYYLELTAGEHDTIGGLIVRFKTAATAEMVAEATVVSYDPYASGPTVASIAQAVGDALMSAFTTPGSLGKLLGDNLNATVGSRSTQASVDTVAGYIDTEVAAILAAVDTEVAAIKAKTDNLPVAPAAVGDIPTAVQNADALLARNAKGGSNGPANQSVAAGIAGGFMKVAIVAGVLTVRYADDTIAFTRTLTRAQLDAITAAV